MLGRSSNCWKLSRVSGTICQTLDEVWSILPASESLPSTGYAAGGKWIKLYLVKLLCRGWGLNNFTWLVVWAFKPVHQCNISDCAATLPGAAKSNIPFCSIWSSSLTLVRQLQGYGKRILWWHTFLGNEIFFIGSVWHSTQGEWGTGPKSNSGLSHCMRVSPHSTTSPDEFRFSVFTCHSWCKISPKNLIKTY